MKRLFDYLFNIACAVLPVLFTQYEPLEVLPLPDRLEQLALTFVISLALVGGIAVLSYCQSNLYNLRAGGVFTALSLVGMVGAAMLTKSLAKARDVSAEWAKHAEVLDVVQCLSYALFYVLPLIALVLVTRLALGLRSVRRGGGEG